MPVWSAKILTKALIIPCLSQSVELIKGKLAKYKGRNDGQHGQIQIMTLHEAKRKNGPLHKAIPDG